MGRGIGGKLKDSISLSKLQYILKKNLYVIAHAKLRFVDKIIRMFYKSFDYSRKGRDFISSNGTILAKIVGTHCKFL